MIYLDSANQSYKYLVNYGDNFVVLSKSSSVNGDYLNPDTIDVLVQYYQPSFYNFKTTYTSTSSRSFTNISNQFSDSLFDRADFPMIFICNFLTILIFAFILNGLTRLVKKGRYLVWL